MIAVVVFHKNPLSARLRLLRFTDGGLIGPDRPDGPVSEETPEGVVPTHPGETCVRLAVAFGQAPAAFKCHAPALVWFGDAPVFAVECTAFDPPEALAAKGDWIEFPEVRSLGPDDRTAARALYGRVMGS